jgi:hypothetical protein
MQNHNGHEITDYFSSLKYVWNKNDYDIVDYIMLREHDPQMLEKYVLKCHSKNYPLFLYCIISFKFTCDVSFSSICILPLDKG